MCKRKIASFNQLEWKSIDGLFSLIPRRIISVCLLLWVELMNEGVPFLLQCLDVERVLFEEKVKASEYRGFMSLKGYS